MKRKGLLSILCAFPLWANAQTIQVLDSVVSYFDENSGVKYEYQYDKKGNAVSETSFFREGNKWVENKKCEYQYEDNKNQTWITLYWDGGSNKWVENRKYEYRNNNTWTTFYRDGNKWVENKKYEYQYDNKKTMETAYFWDNGSNAWTKISTAQYNYYYSPLAINSISWVTGDRQVSVFPNPATNYITVRGTAESVITVSDLSGGIIYNRVMPGETDTIDVSSWASGTYIIAVETGNNRTVSKIIKK